MIRPTARPARRFTDSGYLIRAKSPRSLAELSVDGFALEQTRIRYNENAGRGVDPDFLFALTASLRPRWRAKPEPRRLRKSPLRRAWLLRTPLPPVPAVESRRST